MTPTFDEGSWQVFMYPRLAFGFTGYILLCNFYRVCLVAVANDSKMTLTSKCFENKEML